METVSINWCVPECTGKLDISSFAIKLGKNVFKCRHLQCNNNCYLTFALAGNTPWLAVHFYSLCSQIPFKIWLKKNWRRLLCDWAFLLCSSLNVSVNSHFLVSVLYLLIMKPLPNALNLTINMTNHRIFSFYFCNQGFHWSHSSGP